MPRAIDPALREKLLVEPERFLLADVPDRLTVGSGDRPGRASASTNRALRVDPSSDQPDKTDPEAGVASGSVMAPVA